MKHRLFVLSICFGLSASLVALMGYFSMPEKFIGAGFIRKIPSKKIEGVQFIPLRAGKYYLAGINDCTAYVGNWLNPFVLQRATLGIRHPDTLQLADRSVDRLMSGACLTVMKDSVYLLDGTGGTYFSTDTLTRNLSSARHLPFFSAASVVGNGYFVLRTVQPNFSNRLSTGGDVAEGFSFSLNDSANSMFATDGEMCMTPDRSKVFYVDYYNNQFLCLDNRLQLMYRGKTVDTCSITNVKVSFVASDSSLQLSAPPRQVNIKAAANDDWLFVQSAVKAENDTEESLKQLSVIDVYNTKEGQYQFTIYIPHFKDEKMIDYQVYKNSFVALYPSCVFFYKLNF